VNRPDLTGKTPLAGRLRCWPSLAAPRLLRSRFTGRRHFLEPGVLVDSLRLLVQRLVAEKQSVCDKALVTVPQSQAPVEKVLDAGDRFAFWHNRKHLRADQDLDGIALALTGD
jgi:hypothetical protein